ncbi:DUF4367 domain-containing protein [Candidatus Saccharibacteria bacterium]|nr:DUF4367 domain-containing protein [Candidatus Saccharibacteria bacterium]
MQANKTVEINGRLYDGVTGLPIDKSTKSTEKVVSPATVKKRAVEVAAQSIHAQPERSHTLHRRAAKKVYPTVAKRPKAGQRMDIVRSSKVARFAAHPVAVVVKKPVSTPDVAHKSHPLAARAHARMVKPIASAPVAKTSKQVKDEAIAKALSSPIVKPAKTKRRLRWSRRFTIFTAVFAVLIVGAYLTYVNIPSISVGFAASQAGFAATYPQYKPDGYRLSQPVTYSDGTVTLKFTSNTNTSGYSVVQSRSSWDSSAVLTNVVKKAAGDNYDTTQESGLTIYSYEKNATWVNGGILYTIESNAPLSREQIRHIATSL